MADEKNLHQVRREILRKLEPRMAREALKQALTANLGLIVDSYRAIDAEMTAVPRDRRGIALQSLDKATGEHVAHGNGSINASYRAEDGKRYNIQIRECS